MGTRICAATDPAPTMSPTATSTPMSGAAAETTSPAAVTIRTAGTSQRRVRRSPSGTSRARPTAYPIWAKVTTRPAVPELVPNDRAMSSSTGWA